MIDVSGSVVESGVKLVSLEYPQTISSAALLGKQNQIFIIHDGQRYLLRITKLRKLILTK